MIRIIINEIWLLLIWTNLNMTFWTAKTHSGGQLGLTNKKVQHFFFHSMQHCEKQIKWIFDTISLTQLSFIFKCE
jgi:hypothetical protein